MGKAKIVETVDINFRTGSIVYRRGPARRPRRRLGDRCKDRDGNTWIVKQVYSQVHGGFLAGHYYWQCEQDGRRKDRRPFKAEDLPRWRD